MITLDKLYERDKGICQLCLKPVPRQHGTRPDSPTRDHIVARGWGGSNAASNLQLAHRLCNEFRGHQPKSMAVDALTATDAMSRIRRHFRSSKRSSLAPRTQAWAQMSAA